MPLTSHTDHAGRSASVPVVAVVGATATGKSGLAIALARELGGEVVGADAIQLYRGMDIGTAKVPVPQRLGVPHYQIDVLAVREEASVAAYQRHSRADLASILARGGVPILAGGSGLYVRAVLDELNIPPNDPDVRSLLEADLASLGSERLHERLAALDPVAAERILPSNARRVLRALEVVELTGRPFSAIMPTRTYHRPALTIGVRVPREELDRRIGTRVRDMWAAGLLQEVEALCERGLRAGRTASRAIGYQQALAQLDNLITEPEAITLTARASRRYARRQESWFGADPRIHWLDGTDPGHRNAALALAGAAVEHNEQR